MKKLLLIMPSALILHFFAGCFLSFFVRNPMSIDKLSAYYMPTFPLLLLFACILYAIINLLQRPRRVCVFIIIAILSGVLLLFTYISVFFNVFSTGFFSDFYDNYTDLVFILTAIIFISVYLEVVTTFIKNKKGYVADFETDGMKTSTFIISSVLFLFYVALLIIGICLDDGLYWRILPTLIYPIFFPILLSLIAVTKAVIKLVFKPHRCNIFALLSAIYSIAFIVLHMLNPEFMLLGYHLDSSQIFGIAFVPLCILMYLDFLWEFRRE